MTSDLNVLVILQGKQGLAQIVSLYNFACYSSGVFFIDLLKVFSGKKFSMKLICKVCVKCCEVSTKQPLTLPTPSTQMKVVKDLRSEWIEVLNALRNHHGKEIFICKCPSDRTRHHWFEHFPLIA